MLFYTLYAAINRLLSKPSDQCTRCDRTEKQTIEWDGQLSRLVSSFLRYRSSNEVNGMPDLEYVPEEPLAPVDRSIHVELVDLFSMFALFAV